MKKLSKKILLANTFGTLGYLVCLILWSWIGIVYLPMFLENEQVEKFLLPTPSEDVQPITPAFELPPAVSLVAVIIAVAILAATVIVLIRVPVTVARTGKAVTTKAATSAIPLVTKGQPLAKAEERRLTVQLIKIIKLLLTLIPVAVSSIGLFIAPPIATEIVIFISSLLALLALLWFSLQYIAARALGIDPRQLV